MGDIYTVVEDKEKVSGLKIIAIMQDDKTKCKALLCLNAKGKEVILRCEGDLYISTNVKKVK